MNTSNLIVGLCSPKWTGGDPTGMGGASGKRVDYSALVCTLLEAM